jgi:hypothetical protein
VDLAFYKNITSPAREGPGPFEVFNVFNRVNFVSVNTSLNPLFATLDTGSQRTATRIIDYQPSGSFGQATATRDPRQAQSASSCCSEDRPHAGRGPSGSRPAPFTHPSPRQASDLEEDSPAVERPHRGPAEREEHERVEERRVRRGTEASKKRW